MPSGHETQRVWGYTPLCNSRSDFTQSRPLCKVTPVILHGDVSTEKGRGGGRTSTDPTHARPPWKDAGLSPAATSAACRGTSLIRNSPHPGPYSRAMPRVLGGF